MTDNTSLQGSIYIQQQQQQQQLENPTEANVLLEYPRVRSSARAADTVSTNNNVCLPPMSKILTCTFCIGGNCSGEHDEQPAESSASDRYASLV